MNEFEITIAPSQIDEFFVKLGETGNVTGSAEAAKISRAYVYKLRKTDKSFAARWDEAMGELPERVRDAIVDEAVTGTPVLDDAGRVLGHRRNTSLLARLGEKYGILDPAKPSVAIQNNVTTNAPAAAPTLQAEEQRLHEIAMRELKTITVEATPVDPDEDIL